jgi:RNA polymerase sigma-70 factor (ECF subfamily)
VDRIQEHLLVLRAQIGDRSARTRLFERYEPRLRYYLRRLLREPEDCEDVFQETWLRVVRKLASLDDPSAFRPWLYRIAHNLARSRQRKRREDLSLDDPETPTDALAVDPGQDAEEFDVYAVSALHAALDRLPTTQREAVALRFLEECTYEEIATIVDCSVGTVRSRLHYGKQALHALLTKQPRLPGADLDQDA